jgi:hypothetical protein
VQSWPSVALVAALAVALSGCGSEEAGVSLAQPACVPHGDGHERICGLAPPSRRARGGTAYKVATITGEGFWVVLPDELAPSSGVVAVPGVPVRGIRDRAHLTTASAHDAAGRYCSVFRKCKPAVVSREAVPAGVLTRWDDASGMIRDLAVTTLDLGPWTLVIPGMDADHAERIARTLSQRVDEDGYPRLASTDPNVPVYADWAGVVLWVPDLEADGRHHLMEVIPGCEPSVKEPGLGGSDAGPDLQLLDFVEDPPDTPEPDTVDAARWCVDGRYRVEVMFAGPPRLALFHAKLRIVPARARATGP